MAELECFEAKNARDWERAAWGTGNPRKAARDTTRISSIARLCLPQDDTECSRRFRARELEERRASYKWDFTFNGGKTFPIPDGLPDCEITGLEHVLDAVSHTLTTGIAAIGSAAKDMVRRVTKGNSTDKIEFIKSLYREGTLPPVVATDRWRTDEEFGRQRLGGLYPKMIRKLDEAAWAELEKKFPVAQETTFNNFKSIIGNPSSFAAAIAKGNLYFIDYYLLKDLPAPKERNMTAPIALFVDNEQHFLPLAIQLGQDPKQACIFTPRLKNGTVPAGNVWLAAKIQFQVAEAQYHGVLGHLLHTHWIMESVYTAMRRTVSSRHPVHELLYPHFWFTLVIEFAARHFLIAESNPLPQMFAMGFDGQNEIMARGWQEFDFKHTLNPLVNAADRGVDGVHHYVFLEDSKRIWPVIHRYVTGLVDTFYGKGTGSSDAIAEDTELKAWYNELLTQCKVKGVPVFYNSNPAEFPQAHAALIEFLTTLIFNVSAGHAAVNNTQWDYIGCPINIPSSFYMPIPKRPDHVVTDEDICSGFPGIKDCVVQMGLFRGLSTATYRPLGWYQQTFFAGRPEVAPIVGRFRAELAEVSAEIKKVNEEAREMPYRFLDPEQIAMGIAI